MIAGNAGVLLTRVIRVKRNGNRPPFVDRRRGDERPRAARRCTARGTISTRCRPTGERMTAQHRRADLRDRRHLRHATANATRVEAGDLAVFRTAGAYGATMASSYNSRGFVPEVMVDGDKYAVVADRIPPEEIIRRRTRARMAWMRSLPLFHRIAGQPVIVLGEGPAADAKRRLVERAGGQVVGDLQTGIERGARLAFVAHRRPARGRSRGDAAAPRRACWSTSPTGRSCATSPPRACSTAIRCKSPSAPRAPRPGSPSICGCGSRRCCPLASACSPRPWARRATRCASAGPTRAIAAGRWTRALKPGGPLDPFVEHGTAAVANWLRESGQRAQTTRVELAIATHTPDGLTLRQLQLLGAADAILYESGVPAARPRYRARRCAAPLSAA